MTRLRLAVVGVGHLGRIHARLAAGLPEIELAAVVDPCDEARNAAAKETGASPLADHRDLLGSVDAAVVATPTRTHLSVARELMRGGVHVLVEKPIAFASEEADELVQLARQNQVVLQVGHVERFNPGFESIQQKISDPKYIEARRHSAFTFRSTDIGVVMDLMIHDIDLVLASVNSEIVSVEALGVSVMGGHEDMVNARFQFANGAIANLSASRTSYEPARVMNFYSDGGFASIDFAGREAVFVEPRKEILDRTFQIDELSRQDVLQYRESLFEQLLVKRTLPKIEGNAIENELKDFASAINTGRRPRVNGRDGRNAVAAAEKVLESVAQHCWDGHAAGRVGPLVATTSVKPLAVDSWSVADTAILPRKAG